MKALGGRAYEGAERVDEALADYMQVLALEPDRATVSSNLFIRTAAIYARAGRYCDAASMIRMWESASPDRAGNAQAQSMIARYASKQACVSDYATGQASFPRSAGTTIRVRARVNGAEGVFIVDTGASYVALTSAFAQRARVASERARPIHVQTANGIRVAKLTQANSVTLKSVSAANVPVTVDSGGAAFGAGVDGLLGQSFLSRFDVRFAPAQWPIARR
ncbi:hypothetical protein AWB79_01478 [Caballeronia hypogeia]|uniref:Uncharacterized protein n=1 Tax=Caballeronia hypogeia TaxID=1777140 RepID=A0A157ZY45_9BURK|nr:retroviral-like aspartic protease family protein [Caballeronia hypogeia]SAK49817.1 hypothetical protein AWB79_01478 [Caballeronia hypogeia]